MTLRYIKTALRLSVIPVYLALFFAGVLALKPWGIILNFGLVMTAMWAFVNRPLPPHRYLLAAFFMAFYYVLYWTDGFAPLVQFLNLGTKWVFYGLIYTFLVVGFGVRFIIKHRSSRYQVMRTGCLMAVQLMIAFLLPLILPLLQQPEYYFSYFWPLKVEYFYPSVMASFPLVIVVYSVIGSLAVFPVLALTLGKRFYCSWVCGCGGLAETFGDRWRSLSDKSTTAHRFEMVSIHSVLLLTVIGTAAVVLAWYLSEMRGISVPGLRGWAEHYRSSYAFLVSALLAGVVGVGFYPTLGPRVWCRYFCPMAAMLGLLQKGGLFHIRVKPDMCISCGQCSTYCEMGIDVRAYAQRNETFTRASCVGCGMCAYVCPRGVLRLESRPRRSAQT